MNHFPFDRNRYRCPPLWFAFFGHILTFPGGLSVHRLPTHFAGLRTTHRPSIIFLILLPHSRHCQCANDDDNAISLRARAGVVFGKSQSSTNSCGILSPRTISAANLMSADFCSSVMSAILSLRRNFELVFLAPRNRNTTFDVILDRVLHRLAHPTDTPPFCPRSLIRIRSLVVVPCFSNGGVSWASIGFASMPFAGAHSRHIAPHLNFDGCGIAQPPFPW